MSTAVPREYANHSSMTAIPFALSPLAAVVYVLSENDVWKLPYNYYERNNPVRPDYPLKKNLELLLHLN